MKPQDVLHFWFQETPPGKRFVRDAAFDQTIRERFGAAQASAAQGELWGWRATPEGRLAEIILLDQFSRNLHRDSPLAFAHDGMALVLAQEAVAQGLDAQLDPEQRSFLYMPYMHSESRAVQRESLRLFTALGRAENLDFAHRHAEIVERFGRYPHRNAALGRTSTAEELQFLQQPGSSF